MEGGVEGVGLGGAERHHRGEVAEGVVVRLGAEADRHRERGPGGQHGVGVAGELAAPLRGHGAGVAVDHGLVDPVLHVGLRIGRAEEPLAVGLVLGEEELDGVLAGARVPPALADQVVRRVGHAGPDALDHSPLAVQPPRPRVAVPQMGQDVDRRGLGTAIDHRDVAEDVLGVRLGVLDEHVEVPIGGEYVGHGIEQLELRLPLASRSVGLDERLVREGDLRILVDHFHVGVRRRAVEVEVVFLHVLAVVALLIAEPERALLQERVLLVPQRDGEANGLPVVAESGEPVLAPSIRPAPRVVVREVVPGVSARAVVLSHGAPRAIADVRSPAPPFALARRLLLETRVLSGAAPATWDRGARGRSGRSCGGPPRAAPRALGRRRIGRARSRRGIRRARRAAIGSIRERYAMWSHLEREPFTSRACEDGEGMET